MKKDIKVEEKILKTRNRELFEKIRKFNTENEKYLVKFDENLTTDKHTHIIRVSNTSY